MAENDLLPPPATSPSPAPPPVSSRPAPPLSTTPVPAREVLPVPTLSPPPPIDEPAVATDAVAPVATSSLSSEPLFTVKVWQLGLVVFVVLLALLYALGIL